MRTIVFIGSNKSGSSKDAIIAAEALGFYTVLLTDRETFLAKRAEFPYVHEMILVDIDDMDAIRTELNFLMEQGKDIVAISSFIEPYVYTAALLGQEYGLPSQTPEAIATMLDKIRMREFLKDTHYSPLFWTCDDYSEVTTSIRRHLPLVVKSPLSSGSRDVILVTDRAQLEQEVNGLKKRYPDQKVLLEEYIDGPQYLAEVLVHRGKPHIVAVVEQIVHGKPHFIVTGYRVLLSPPIHLHSEIDNLVHVVAQKTGMRCGAFHVEFRVVNRRCKIIEVNPRISGTAMNRMIDTAFGINLVQETLKSQMDQTPNLERRYERHVFTQYLTVSQSGVLQKVTGRIRASKCAGVEEVYVKPRSGTTLRIPTSMGHRYAYVLAAADSHSQAEKIARDAAKLIQFHITPELR
ncbi:ATP-grasp domain-containing protein [Alicyclobacillus dauci]|uniref:ATP-grasp domain-containing protein n=1 Tax=Alicyclobacillus dauci TaxID=1475485 RepID=A0ABY6Z097_9BACL|nr:ATP-grasp domain-containing protein [Alicyclobacillus dauci]WAH36308.1 ATP-grasp domain-containing protein [Alicyclobacillus dauci]